jgi:hypothetical protein
MLEKAYHATSASKAIDRRTDYETCLDAIGEMRRLLRECINPSGPSDPLEAIDQIILDNQFLEAAFKRIDARNHFGFVVAAKAAFINDVADLCGCVGAAFVEVPRGMGLDARIGAVVPPGLSRLVPAEGHARPIAGGEAPRRPGRNVRGVGRRQVRVGLEACPRPIVIVSDAADWPRGRLAQA